MFGIRHEFGDVYHPLCTGLVDRANRTIEKGLAKVCAVSELTWVEALPIVSFTLGVTEQCDAEF